MVQNGSTSRRGIFKHVKHTRLIGAGLTLVLTLWCMWWLYGQEFRYPNTEAGRMEILQNYIVAGEGMSLRHVEPEDPLRCIAWQEVKGNLFVFYGADNDDNVHGIVRLTRGLNGKYRTEEASMNPFPYTAGIYGENFNDIEGEEDFDLFALGGDNCREIYEAQIEFYVYPGTEGRVHDKIKANFSIPEPDFLWMFTSEEMCEKLGVDPEHTEGFQVDEVRLLDKDGNDVTDQYRAPGVEQNWGSGKGTAEQFLLYVYMGIVALLGLVIVKYFLRKN